MYTPTGSTKVVKRIVKFKICTCLKMAVVQAKTLFGPIWQVAKQDMKALGLIQTFLYLALITKCV